MIKICPGTINWGMGIWEDLVIRQNHASMQKKKPMVLFLNKVYNVIKQ